MANRHREEIVKIKEHVDSDLSRMRAMQEEDVAGAMIMGWCSVEDGQLFYASEEEIKILGALIDRRLVNPTFDAGQTYEWLVSLPQDLKK